MFFARDPADRRLWWTGPTSDGRKASGVSEVINDLHGDLMNFYRVLKDTDLFGQLQHRLDLTLFSEAEWHAARELLDGAGASAVERAAAFFTLCRQSLSGRMTAPAPTVRARLRGGRNDGVNGWWTAVDGLEAVDEFAVVAVGILAGHVEQCPRDCQRCAQFVGGIGCESLLFGDVCFEPREHGVEGVGEFAELIAAAR